MKIGRHEVGPGQPVYLLAEMGSNHGGNLETALQLIRTAAKAGADGVKAQFFTADVMVEKGHPDYKTYQQCELPSWWFAPMRKCTDEHGIDFVLSVFAPEHVPLVVPYVDAIKIASAELTYTPLLEAVVATGKPVILSTGMATAAEVVKAAVTDLPHHYPVAVLHCVSAYPAPPEDMNLTAGATSWCPWGLSDHTEEPFAAPLMAAALGASVIEKHYRLLDSTGPDADFAIYPAELAALARALHNAHLLLLGEGVKRVMPSEEASLSDRRTVHADGRWLRG